VPADDKKVRDYLIARTLLRTLKRLELRYPTPDFDIATCRARLLASKDAPEDTTLRTHEPATRSDELVAPLHAD
jgi:hypothetical protein